MDAFKGCEVRATDVLWDHRRRVGANGVLNRDLLNVLDSVSRAGAKFRSLADRWADTSTMHGELMITILAGLATFERHLIRARTDDGRERAQARGVRFGRPLKLSKFQIAEALVRREAGENLTDIGRSYGVSHSTISRL